MRFIWAAWHLRKFLPGSLRKRWNLAGYNFSRHRHEVEHSPDGRTWRYRGAERWWRVLPSGGLPGSDGERASQDTQETSASG